MGHKKRMQMMRMEWINQGKPQTVHADSLFDEPALPTKENDNREKTASRIAPIFETTGGERPKTPTPKNNEDDDMEEEDLYGATPKATRQKPAEDHVPQSDSLFGGAGASIFGPAKTVAEDDLDDDELDALLAEDEMMQAAAGGNKSAAAASKATAPQNDFDEDDMEAMAEMDMEW